jgi:hypothetical protein
MSHDPQDEHFLTGIEDASDQPKFVPANVKDHAVPNEVSVSERRANITPVLPSD